MTFVHAAAPGPLTPCSRIVTGSHLYPTFNTDALVDALLRKLTPTPFTYPGFPVLVWPVDPVCVAGPVVDDVLLP